MNNTYAYRVRPYSDEEANRQNWHLVTEGQDIGFSVVIKQEPSMLRGSKKVNRQGQNGKILTTYEVDRRNGHLTLVNRETIPATNQIVVV